MNRESDSSILCMGSLSSVERSDYNQSHLATTLYPHDGPDVGIRFHRRRRRVGLCIVHAGDMPAFLSSGAEDTNLFTEVLLPSGRSEQICPPRRFRSRLSVNMELGRVQNLGRRAVPSIRDTPHYPMPVDDRPMSLHCSLSALKSLPISSPRFWQFHVPPPSDSG